MDKDDDFVFVIDGDWRLQHFNGKIFVMHLCYNESQMLKLWHNVENVCRNCGAVREL